MHHLGRPESRRVMALCASLVLAGCGASRPGARGQYEQAKDSATQASLSRPALGVRQVGEKAPVIPPLRPIRAPVAVGLAAAGALGGQAVIDNNKSLDAELRERIEEALAQCADKARADVMDEYFRGRRPTAEACAEEVGTDSQGKPITLAMKLGVEQHRVALSCVDEELKALKPGGFSLSPRYRYDPATGKAEYLPRETVQELLRQGRGEVLRGTLEPDVVIHGGAPHQVQAVYDYKFPCMNTDRQSQWRTYSSERLDGVRNQGDLYWRALKVTPRRVQPHLGVY